ncbi:MAG TPA: haloacid dehalogenase type II [Steroidobacteraceae bacterium]|jgi:2-haloacid dehalogenase|nr:haloacid dehalogenase type II [Steroidobacteraceae bacterium]
MMSRRSVLALGAAGMAVGVSAPAWIRGTEEPAAIRAVAFDAFALFDPRPVFNACESMFPGRGAELAILWRTRQFEYQWLRSLSGRYADFWSVTRAALEFAARSLNLNLTGGQRDDLMQGYLFMSTWPDVQPALAALRRAGKHLIMLSNATDEILRAGVRNSAVESMFAELISTDRIKSFKPDPRAYQLGVDRLGLRREAILFVAYAGWDAAGAKWFGYPTFWNNRQHASLEALDVVPDGAGESLQALTEFI